MAASEPLAPLVQGENVAWLQPLPDSLLDAGDPARTVIERSSLRLAFAAALQHLSARQRGALILRDVLSFSASETAEVLGTTVVSVNSSLQRARTRVKEVGVRQERVSEPSAAEQRAWVERYMKAFELADVEGLKRLLTEDVLMEMPPMLNWFVGRSNYGLFMEWVFGAAGKDWLLKEVAANGGQPGFAAYQRVGGGYQLHTLQIFTVTAEGISRNSVFQGSEVFAASAWRPDSTPRGLSTSAVVLSRVPPHCYGSLSVEHALRSLDRGAMSSDPVAGMYDEFAGRPGRADHKGESDDEQSCGRRGRNPGRAG